MLGPILFCLAQKTWTCWSEANKGPRWWCWEWSIWNTTSSFSYSALEEKAQWGLINVYKYLMLRSKDDAVGLFSVISSEMTRGNRHETQEFSFKRDKKKKCLPWEWSNSSTGLPIEAVESPSLRIFNAWLDTTCCNLLKLNLLEKGIKSPGVPFSWICESIFTFLPCFDTIPTIGRYLFLLLIEIDTSFY